LNINNKNHTFEKLEGEHCRWWMPRKMEYFLDRKFWYYFNIKEFFLRNKWTSKKMKSTIVFRWMLDKIISNKKTSMQKQIKSQLFYFNCKFNQFSISVWFIRISFVQVISFLFFKWKTKIILVQFSQVSFWKLKIRLSNTFILKMNLLNETNWKEFSYNQSI
jgi:hypothetical protein